MFQLSERSLSKLDGVDAGLCRIVKVAIQVTEVDFGISQGLRTLEEQKKMYKLGASKTMNSKHLDGRAIDVFAYVDGAARWEIEYYIKIAEAFKRAAEGQNIGIRWGGAWNVPDIRKMEPKTAYHHYLREKARQKRIPFVDGPHFELS